MTDLTGLGHQSGQRTVRFQGTELAAFLPEDLEFEQVRRGQLPGAYRPTIEHSVPPGDLQRLGRPDREASFGVLGGHDEVVLDEKHHLFDQIRKRLAPKPRWRIEVDEIVLASLSFLKFVMFKDLEANEDLFSTHPLLKKLLGQGQREESDGILGLPEDPRQ